MFKIFFIIDIFQVLTSHMCPADVILMQVQAVQGVAYGIKPEIFSDEPAVSGFILPSLIPLGESCEGNLELRKVQCHHHEERADAGVGFGCPREQRDTPSPAGDFPGLPAEDAGCRGSRSAAFPLSSSDALASHALVEFCRVTVSAGLVKLGRGTEGEATASVPASRWSRLSAGQYVP